MTEPEEQEEQREPTAAELRDATIWRILRAAYLRVLCDQIGKRPIQLLESEQNALLDRWLPAMERDVEMLREVTLNAQAAGAAEVREQLHQTAVDTYASDELLDEALEHVVEPVVEAPYMQPPRLQWDEPKEPEK